MAAPNDVKGNEFLEYALLRKKTQYMEQNAKNWARTKKADVGDKFRSLMKRKQRGFHRGYLPTYGKEVLTVAAVREGGRVVRATNGKDYVTTKILIVPGDFVEANFAPLEFAERQRKAAYRAMRQGYY